VLSNDNNDNGPISDVREPRLNLAALGIGLSTPSPSVSSSAAVNANAAAASMPSFTAVSFDDDDVERARLNDPLQDYAGDPANPLLRQQLAAKREPRTRWWGFGVVFLVLAVAALLTFIFRDALATNLPRLRAPFAAVCERLGCKLAYMRDASAIKIDSSDFTESPTKPGRYLLVATLANRSGIKQDLPHLDLRLTDNANQAVLSRTISPAEYLGRPLTTDDGIVPIGNISVNLELEVVGKTAASGYAIVAFYP
jgi:hypothetical protein